MRWTTPRDDYTLHGMNGKLNGALKTASDVIDALGGTQEVAGMFGLAYGVVWNWRDRGLPSDTYAAMHKKLARLRLSAPDELWKQREAH